jgi:hypothetical protein
MTFWKRLGGQPLKCVILGNNFLIKIIKFMQKETKLVNQYSIFFNGKTGIFPILFNAQKVFNIFHILQTWQHKTPS